MTAREYAQYVFRLMEKAGYPYMSPELDDDEIYGVPPVVKVWDANQGMIRLIAFADDEAGAVEALQYARDVFRQWITLNITGLKPGGSRKVIRQPK